MIKTILDYWQNVYERGDKPRPVWLVVSQGTVQPRGYILGWSINKRAAQRMVDDHALKQNGSACLLRLT